MTKKNHNSYHAVHNILGWVSQALYLCQVRFSWFTVPVLVDQRINLLESFLSICGFCLLLDYDFSGGWRWLNHGTRSGWWLLNILLNHNICAMNFNRFLGPLFVNWEANGLFLSSLSQESNLLFRIIIELLLQVHNRFGLVSIRRWLNLRLLHTWGCLHDSGVFKFLL